MIQRARDLGRRLAELAVAALLAAAVVLTVSGCTTIEAARAEQAKWQALADQATQHYGVSYVRVELKGSGYDTSWYSGGVERRIEFGGYRAWAAKAIFAHELSHHLLGHARSSNTTVADEIAANNRAVRVMQLWDTNERDAFLMMAWLLRSNERTVLRSHQSFCDELVALHAAYPGQIEPDKYVAHGCPAVGADGTQRGDTATGR